MFTDFCENRWKNKFDEFVSLLTYGPSTKRRNQTMESRSIDGSMSTIASALRLGYLIDLNKEDDKLLENDALIEEDSDDDNLSLPESNDGEASVPSLLQRMNAVEINDSVSSDDVDIEAEENETVAEFQDIIIYTLDEILIMCLC